MQHSQSRCCTPLRYLALRHVKRDLRPKCLGAGLSQLALILLDVTIDKSYQILCGNLEARPLSLQQESYAANDAFIAVAIFFQIVHSKVRYEGKDLDSIVWSGVFPLCQGIVDIKFKPKHARTDDEGGTSSPENKRTNSASYTQHTATCKYANIE